MRKNMNFRYIAFLLISILFYSCEMTVEVDVPEVKPKLVVFGFINPHDEEIRIIVRSSNPLFSDEETNTWAAVEDAAVILEGGGQSVQLTFDYQEQVFFVPASEFTIQPGMTYHVQVTATDFLPALASTTVPLHVPVFTQSTVESIETTSPEGYQQIISEFDFKWLDVNNQDNFYELSIQRYGSEVANLLVKDEGRDGEELREDFMYSGGYTIPQEPFRVYLLHCSEDYFLYKRSIENINQGNPFSEPSLIYSNIENGLGCFASYTGNSIVLNP